jgi:hypothetical protein
VAKDKKPLPTPPNRKKRFVREDEEAQLLSDKLAMAQSQGRLDELLEDELGENEQARKLVSMMMGMSGMDMSAAMHKGKPAGSQMKEKTGAPEEPPEDVMLAAMSGDLSGLAQLLKRESEKRRGEGQTAASEGREREPATPQPGNPQAEPVFERATIDQLIQMAAENGVSVDWLINRALTLYVRDHRSTGRL